MADETAARQVAQEYIPFLQHNDKKTFLKPKLQKTRPVLEFQWDSSFAMNYGKWAGNLTDVSSLRGKQANKNDIEDTLQ